RRARHDGVELIEAGGYGFAARSRESAMAVIRPPGQAPDVSCRMSGAAEIRRRRGTAVKEELFHFLFEKLARLWLDGRQAVFVDEHGLVAEPLLPSLLRHVLVDPLVELAWIRGVV